MPPGVRQSPILVSGRMVRVCMRAVHYPDALWSTALRNMEHSTTIEMQVASAQKVPTIPDNIYQYLTHTHVAMQRLIQRQSQSAICAYLCHMSRSILNGPCGSYCCRETVYQAGSAGACPLCALIAWRGARAALSRSDRLNSRMNSSVIRRACSSVYWIAGDFIR